MKKLIPILLPVIALIGGAFAGDHLRPAPQVTEDAEPETPPPPSDTPINAGYFKFPTQFFVPLTRNGDMGAVMVLTVTLETEDDALPMMQKQEHRLRDALLRELLIHGNTGGFDGNFTAERNLRILRERLIQAARRATDQPITTVLIEDIARQGR
ncbi:hypothetical protein [Paracoccus sp. (in: a-proteobacteria)]|uniref:hypothetical protein n=1 Tax=Paracoccus sp. TaxID=267 RepID=UPI0026E087CA|nr:hypothetical protein [Paracoccus sp. (in: a-proteobacteria)]MDO5648307.1 hypothetical protein [Paracoccus sp. (in: a-proteobacteria)]